MLLQARAFPYNGADNTPDEGCLNRPTGVYILSYLRRQAYFFHGVVTRYL